MPNTILTNSLIAKEALIQLENEMVMANLVHRVYEDEFSNRTNGYSPGETISIRKPNRYNLRTGANMAVQDSVEGKTSLTVDTQLGVDLGGWTSKDRTLNITQFSERFIKPAMRTIAQGVDAKIMSNYTSIWNWVGTPGNLIDSFADFARGPQRLDEMAVPGGDRNAVLSAADHWAMLGNLSGSYIQDTAKTALQRAKLPMLGGVDAYMTQNVPTLTAGTRDNSTPLTRGTGNTTTWAVAKDLGTMVLSTDGWDNSATIEEGMVFTIADVYAVNPVSKAVLPYLQQFTVRSAVTAAASSANETQVTISPPIITSGPYQTVNSAPGNDKTIEVLGTASLNYRQNMVFHKNAFALAVVPMIKPEGAVDVQRVSYKGLSVRMIPVYTGADDTSAIRLDVLLGTKAVHPDLATRISG